MESLINLLFSKTFMALLLLVVVLNVVRRFARKARRRGTQAQRRLRDNIWERRRSTLDDEDQP